MDVREVDRTDDYLLIFTDRALGQRAEAVELDGESKRHNFMVAVARNSARALSPFLSERISCRKH